jgi:glycosyltransferase involved in cell wall biosynthesis
MRVAIVYDCLYPNTVGGVERWYRCLANQVDQRHDLTYVTRRQWPRDGDPDTPFRTIAVAPAISLYTAGGRRRISEALLWAAGLFWHLLRHGRGYDVVHTATAPYLSLVAAWLALRLGRSRAKLVVDWFEVWGRDYWKQYLGPVGGRIGHVVEVACMRVGDLNFTFSELHAKRLVEHRGHGPTKRLTGLYEELRDNPQPGGRHEAGLVVFAGRHIPDKRVTAIPAAIARARTRVPAVKCVIFGDGPDTDRLIEEIERLGLGAVVELRGRVSADEVGEGLASAACMVLPSRREGYGLVVIESVARGTPVVVVRAPDNSATELVDQGDNGMIAESADPAVLGAAIAEVLEAGEALRERTRSWYERNAPRLSVEGSIEDVERSYRELAVSQARR